VGGWVDKLVGDEWTNVFASLFEVYILKSNWIINI
jgi:hypothetical protein